MNGKQMDKLSKRLDNFIMVIRGYIFKCTLLLTTGYLLTITPLRNPCWSNTKKGFN